MDQHLERLLNRVVVLELVLHEQSLQLLERDLAYTTLSATDQCSSHHTALPDKQLVVFGGHRLVEDGAALFEVLRIQFALLVDVEELEGRSKGTR